MKISRRSSVTWQGGFNEGKGAITTASGALKSYPYGFSSRFDGVPGSNPEELVGTAHASCFTMALALLMSEAHIVPAQLDTSAEVVLESVPDGFAITRIHLTLQGRVPGLDSTAFEAFAHKAKQGCPVSKLLKAEVTLSATLVS